MSALIFQYFTKKFKYVMAFFCCKFFSRNSGSRFFKSFESTDHSKSNSFTEGSFSKTIALCPLQISPTAYMSITHRVPIWSQYVALDLMQHQHMKKRRAIACSSLGSSHVVSCEDGSKEHTVCQNAATMPTRVGFLMNPKSGKGNML